MAKQKKLFLSLYYCFRQIFLFFWVAVVTASASTKSLTTLIIRKNPKISSAWYQQLYLSILIQEILLENLFGLVSINKNKEKNKSIICKCLYFKQDLKI